LKKAISDLSTQVGDKLKGYVIDLRNNPGRLLDQMLMPNAHAQPQHRPVRALRPRQQSRAAGASRV
jgi:C-terminal processing protease CtpA/Prc